MKTAQCPCARTTARQLRLFSVEFALRNACYSDSQCEESVFFFLARLILFECAAHTNC